MKNLWLLILLFVNIDLLAQIKPTLLPEDIHLGEIKVRCFCKPGVIHKSRSQGVRLNYGLLGSGTYREEEGTIFNDPKSSYSRIQNIEFSLKAPIIRKDNFKLLLGYKYFSESFSFQNIGNEFDFAFQALDDELLKSNSLSLIISQSFDEKSYAVFRLSYSSDGDYDNWMSFQNKYAIYKIFGLYAQKPHEGLEWGIGVAGSKSFRRSGAIPIILFNKNFSPKWGIESVLPGFIFGRYNINFGNILLFGVEYDSQSYRMDFSGTNLTAYAYAYNHSEIISSLRLQHQFSDWIWGHLKLGYQINFNSDFQAKNDASPVFQADPSNAIIFKIGIFISPPDSFK